MFCPPVAAEYPLSTINVIPSCLLNTALAMPLVSPLCQKPPSPIIATGRRVWPTLNAEALAAPSPYPMILLPRLNGGSVEKEWQPISALILMAPSSRCRSLIEEKSGRSGQPVQRPDGRSGTAFFNSATGTNGTVRDGATTAAACSTS